MRARFGESLGAAKAAARRRSLRLSRGGKGGSVERKNPGSISVLVSNPRWERRLLKFLELSGVGRVMDDGRDEEEVRAARLDNWVIFWEWAVPRAPD